MKILFQGDSVTDAGRDRADPHHLGGGYPKFAAEYIRAARPDVDFEFLNLGISGNRTEHILARMQSDIIDLQPDIMTLMIGVNDVWHHYDFGEELYVSAEKFEENLSTILRETRAKTPARIVLIEPFILPAEDKLKMLPELDEKIRIIRALAREYADALLPLHALFAARLVGGDWHTYSPDGVHPNDEGRRFIAEELTRVLCPVIDRVNGQK